MVFVIASTIQSMASTSAPTISRVSFARPNRSAVPGSNTTGSATTTQSTPIRRALRSGSVASQRCPLASTTAIAAHESPIMKSASPNVESTPITQSSSHSDGEARTDDQREADRGSGAAFAGACWGRGFSAGPRPSCRRGSRIDDGRRLRGRGRLGRAGARPRRAVRRAPRFGHRVSIGARPQRIGSPPRRRRRATSESSTPDSTARIAPRPSARTQTCGRCGSRRTRPSRGRSRSCR